MTFLCQKCGTDLKNEVSDIETCPKCGVIFSKIKEHYTENRMYYHKKFIQDNIYQVPIVTIHSPPGWDFETSGIVTSQSTTGTGPFSDIEKAISDLFGGQSSSLNFKIESGVKTCLQRLQYEALAKGCNAIVGTEIKFEQIGGTSAIIMVCASGTAVKLNNIKTVYPEKETVIGKLFVTVEIIKKLYADKNTLQNN